MKNQIAIDFSPETLYVTKILILKLYLKIIKIDIKVFYILTLLVCGQICSKYTK